MQISKHFRRTKQGYIHYCPACDESHHYRTDQPDRPNWSFNGNLEKPTFTPSMLIRSGNKVPGHETKYDEGSVCHYFMTDGKIIYLGDCTHAMAGKTVDLPELPERMQGDRYGDGNP